MGDEQNSEALYHYTDAHGLVGILNTSWAPWPLKSEQEIGYHRVPRLLMSDVRFMNDTEELRFGTQRLRERLQSRMQDPSTPPVFASAFGDIIGFLNPEDTLDWPRRCFATCFCSKGDLLSQWRGYAGGTGGFAIGFSQEALRGRTYAFHPHRGPDMVALTSDPILRPVAYGRDAGAAAIDAHIDELMARSDASLMTDGRPQTRNMARNLLFSLLVDAVTTVKDSAFEEEQEWRLVLVSETQFPVKVRARARGLVPYMDVAVNINYEDGGSARAVYYRDHPTIVDLVVGPGPDQAEQVPAARELLRITGHNSEVVRPSTVPFRG